MRGYAIIAEHPSASGRHAGHGVWTAGTDKATCNDVWTDAASCGTRMEEVLEYPVPSPNLWPQRALVRVTERVARCTRISLVDKRHRNGLTPPPAQSLHTLRQA